MPTIEGDPIPDPEAIPLSMASPRSLHYPRPPLSADEMRLLPFPRPPLSSFELMTKILHNPPRSDFDILYSKRRREFPPDESIPVPKLRTLEGEIYNWIASSMLDIGYRFMDQNCQELQELFLTDTEFHVVPLATSATIRLTDFPFQTWQSRELFFVSYLLTLFCGAPPEGRHIRDSSTVRWSDVLTRCLQLLPDDYRPLYLWLATLEWPPGAPEFRIAFSIYEKQYIACTSGRKSRNRFCFCVGCRRNTSLALCRARNALNNWHQQCGEDFSKKLVTSVREPNDFPCICGTCHHALSAARAIQRPSSLFPLELQHRAGFAHLRPQDDAIPFEEVAELWARRRWPRRSPAERRLTTSVKQMYPDRGDTDHLEFAGFLRSPPDSKPEPFFFFFSRTPKYCRISEFIASRTISFEKAKIS